MITSFFVVDSQVVTLFLLMGVGFVMAQLGKLHTDGVSQMSTLVLYVVTPCLMISSFEVERTEGMVGTLAAFFAAYTVSTLLCLAAAQLCFRHEPPDRRAPLRFGMIYGNNGFMGLPLVLSILGQEALIFGVVSAVAFNFLMWTQGVKTMGGKVTLRSVVVNPATVGMVVGLTLFFTGWRPPAMVDNAVGFLADLNTPLAMVVIGAQMAGADLKVSFTSRKLYGAAAVRLLLAPLIAMAALLPFRLEPMAYCACVILCAVPTAGATGMFAQRFQRDTAVAAQLVTLTTLLSVITLPLFAVLAQQLSGLS